MLVSEVSGNSLGALLFVAVLFVDGDVFSLLGFTSLLVLEMQGSSPGQSVVSTAKGPRLES